jgi:hypothetical protein
MKPCDQEHHAQGGDADALEDTQRTRLEPELVLRVVGVPEERNASNEACEIQQSAIRRHAADRT